jgi:hypothetical protein
MNGKDIDSIRELFNSYKDHSDEWRASMNDKIGKIFDRLDCLPCRQNEEKHKNAKEQLIAIWTIISATTVGFIGWILHK